MLYWLVGSQGLDGGLMCTASHNPKAYTGAKLVREGALALSGDSGIQDVRRFVESHLAEPLPGASAPGSCASWTIYARVPARRAALHRRRRGALRTRAESGRGRRQRHGGTDGRAAARGPRPGAASRPTGRRTASSPTTSPTRCCRRTEPSSSRRSARRARTSASPGTATRTAASSSTTSGEFVDGDFLTALLAESLLRKSG